MTTSTQSLSPLPAGDYEETIAGRFRHLTPTQLAMAWWCYHEGHLSRLGLRAWFALHEVAERRWVCAETDAPRYQLAELSRLLGGGAGGGNPEKLLRSSLRSLERLGLASWSPDAIHFARSPDELALAELDGLYAMLREIPNLRRRICVPRRLVRSLAAGFGRGVTATILGHVLTSLYAHREHGRYRVDGRCKASWIAETFGVSERAVKDARARLVALGWLEVLEAPQWQLNKWGAHTRINVAWKLPANDDARSGGGGESGHESAPPALESGHGSAPPCLEPDALPDRKRKKNQTPAPDPRPGPSRAGVLLSRKKKRPSSTNKPPSTIDIQPDDLEEFERTTELYRDACERGLATDSEHGEFQFLCLVERARARGQDPCRMLAWLLRHQRFDYITQADEDAALERMRRRERWDSSPEPRSAGRLSVEPPPDDVLKYIALLQAVERSRTTLGVGEVASAHLGWSAERFEQAESDYLAWQHEKAVAAGGVAESLVF